MPSTQISHPRASANFTSCFAASQWKRERSCELKMTDWGSDHGQGLSCSGAGFQGRGKRIKPGKKNKTRKKCSYGLRLLVGNYLIKNTKILSPTYHSLDFFLLLLLLYEQCKLKDSRPINWDSRPIYWPAAGFAVCRVLLSTCCFLQYRTQLDWVNSQVKYLFKHPEIEHSEEPLRTDPNRHMSPPTDFGMHTEMSEFKCAGAHWCSYTQDGSHVWQKCWLKREVCIY